MVSRLKHNYYLIIRNLLRYLPAKMLVVLCSFLIIPILTHILDVKQVSIYLVSVQILNLFCTFSTDWIAKAVLRFYIKYNLENKIREFVSAIFFISLVSYSIILLLFLILKNFINTNLIVSNLIFAIVVLLVIPTGLRQVLYQMVRIKNRAGLYTLSIVFYQTTFIAGVLILVNPIPSALAIILAMLFAMISVDIYLINSLKLSPISFCKPEKEMVLNIYKYACPLVITNISYWLLLNSPLLIFQKMHEYIYSASLSISSTITNCVITTFAGLFLFVTFPVFVKDYELNKNIKPFFTNLIQLYLYVLLPLTATCCLFSDEIVHFLFPPQYALVGKILPFFSVMYFSHELLKIINIKYHLGNKTYLEMGVNASIILITLLVMPFLLTKYSVLGALVMLLFTEIMLFVLNISLKIKNIDYINYFKVMKTFVYQLLIIFVIYFLLSQIALPSDKFLVIGKVVLFLIFTYFVNYCFRKQMLY